MTDLWMCTTCKSMGFEVSVLGKDRCTFCDGTEGGNPPTQEEIDEAADASGLKKLWDDIKV